MATTIAVQMTPQGLLIPRAALSDWGMQELEAVRERGMIVIRPKSMPADTRALVRQILRSARGE